MGNERIKLKVLSAFEDIAAPSHAKAGATFFREPLPKWAKARVEEALAVAEEEKAEQAEPDGCPLAPYLLAIGFSFAASCNAHRPQCCNVFLMERWQERHSPYAHTLL